LYQLPFDAEKVGLSSMYPLLLCDYWDLIYTRFWVTSRRSKIQKEMRERESLDLDAVA